MLLTEPARSITVLSTAHLAFPAQVVVLEFQMGTGLVGVMPAAISVKLATGVVDVIEEVRHLGLNRGRRVCCKRNGENKHAEQRTKQYYFR